MKYLFCLCICFLQLILSAQIIHLPYTTPNADDRIFSCIEDDQNLVFAGTKKNLNSVTVGGWIIVTDADGSLIKEKQLFYGDTMLVLTAIFMEADGYRVMGMSGSKTLSRQVGFEFFDHMVSISLDKDLNVISEHFVYPPYNDSLRITSVKFKQIDFNRFTVGLVFSSKLTTDGPLPIYMIADTSLAIQKHLVDTIFHTSPDYFWEWFAYGTEIVPFNDSSYLVVKGIATIGLYKVLDANLNPIAWLMDAGSDAPSPHLGSYYTSAKKLNDGEFLIAGSEEIYGTSHDDWDDSSSLSMSIINANLQITNHVRLHKQAQYYQGKDSICCFAYDAVATGEFGCMDFVYKDKIYLAGRYGNYTKEDTYNPTLYDSIYMGMIDSNLHIIWQRKIAGALHFITNVKALKDGSCLALGYRYDSSDWNNWAYDPFVIKVNETGVVTSAFSLAKPVSINWSVYPNPASNSLHVEAPSKGTFKIYSISGQLIHQSSDKNIIDCSGWRPGPYIATFTDINGNVGSKKIVIER